MPQEKILWYFYMRRGAQCILLLCGTHPARRAGIKAFPLEFCCYLSGKIGEMLPDCDRICTRYFL